LVVYYTEASIQKLRSSYNTVEWYEDAVFVIAVVTQFDADFA